MPRRWQAPLTVRPRARRRPSTIRRGRDGGGRLAQDIGPDDGGWAASRPAANIDWPGRLSIKERGGAERASPEKVPSQGARDFPEPPQGRPAATASSPGRGGEATPVAAAGATVKIEATTRPDPEATLAKPNPFQALGEQIKDAFGAMLCVQKRKPGAPPARKGCF